MARDDRSRTCGGDSIAALTIPFLPELGLPADVQQTVALIDVLWFTKATGKPVCAFEVEQSTSIYSGILRMKDLAMSVPDQQCHFYLVAPESREKEAVAQMLWRALRAVKTYSGSDTFPRMSSRSSATRSAGTASPVGAAQARKGAQLGVARHPRRGPVRDSAVHRPEPAGTSPLPSLGPLHRAAPFRDCGLCSSDLIRAFSCLTRLNRVLYSTQSRQKTYLRA